MYREPRKEGSVCACVRISWVLVCGKIVHRGLLCSQPQEFKTATIMTKRNGKQQTLHPLFGASGAGPMPALIPAVTVTMTITKTTLLVPLFVFKSPSL